MLKGEHDCDFDAQFEWKVCRAKLDVSATVCGGAVSLRYDWGNPSIDDVCRQPLPDSLVLWSVGNHALGGEHLLSDALCHFVADKA